MEKLLDRGCLRIGLGSPALDDDLRSRSATLAMTMMRAMKLIPTLEPSTAPAADLQSPEGSHRHTVMLT